MFKILPHTIELFLEYQFQNEVELEEKFAVINATEFSADNFKFYTSVSVISSSKIEGELMEIDSYVKHKMLNIEYLPNLTEKPNDLFAAYTFAQENNLTKEHFFTAHKLIAKHLLPDKQQGSVRKNEIFVLEHNSNKIQYQAAAVSIVNIEFEDLWSDIETLIKSSLAIEEVFYFASMIHLIFENIHPFNDGNGRAGRLLEKWFLAEKLGAKTWSIASEKYYYNNVNNYYLNLNKVGNYYNNLDYSKSLPFLLMLPKCLQTNEQ